LRAIALGPLLVSCGNLRILGDSTIRKIVYKRYLAISALL